MVANILSKRREHYVLEIKQIHLLTDNNYVEKIMNASKNIKDDETTHLSSLYELKTCIIVLEGMDKHQINQTQCSTKKRNHENCSIEQNLAEGTSDVEIDYQPATKIFKKDPDEQSIAGLESMKQAVFKKPQHVNEESLKKGKEIKLTVDVFGDSVKSSDYRLNIKTEYFENEVLKNTGDMIEMISNDDETSKIADVKMEILSDNPVKLNSKKKAMQNLRKNSHDFLNGSGTKRVTRSSTGSLGFRMMYVESSEDEEEENNLTDDDPDYEDDKESLKSRKKKKFFYNKDDGAFSDSNEDSVSPDIVVAVSASYEEKVKVVEMTLENPSWTIADIKKQSNCKYIENRQQIECWINQVKSGGSYQDKLKKINEWVLEKFDEYKKKGKKITNEIIRDWGLEAKNILVKNIKFTASKRWLKSFKERYNIYEDDDDGLVISGSLKKKNPVSEPYRTRVYVPYEKKVKAVNLARENPTWSLKEIRKQSGCIISNRGQLNKWAKQQLKDETSRSKHRRMNTWIRGKCIEYMKNGKNIITNKMLVDWRLEAKKTLKISDLIIEGNANWVQRFKYKYRINSES